MLLSPADQVESCCSRPHFFLVVAVIKPSDVPLYYSGPTSQLQGVQISEGGVVPLLQKRFVRVCSGSGAPGWMAASAFLCKLVKLMSD